MNVLTKSERLELILTYYILWKIKKERRIVRKVVRYTTPRATPFTNSDLAGASIADLGTKDHDLLDGLADDDHTIYPLLLGRAGGQTLIGDTASGGDLTLESTSHATKGYIISDSTLIGGDVTLAISAYDLGRSAAYWDSGYIKTVQLLSLTFGWTTGSVLARSIAGGDVWFRTQFGGASTAARLVTEAAGSGAWYIDRAGDITQLADKTLIFNASTAVTIDGAGNAAILGTNTILSPNGAANDDLDSITAGTDGQVIIIRGDGTFNITVKDVVGNIDCAGDFVMDNIMDTMMLMYDGPNTTWIELSRSDNA